MFAYCNNNPVAYTDPEGKSVIGAMVGGAIAGGLVSAVSHLCTTDDYSLGSVAEAFAIGAATGALGGLAGTYKSLQAVVSIAAGVVAGVYAGVTSSGSTAEKWTKGVSAFLVTGAFTYWGAGLGLKLNEAFKNCPNLGFVEDAFLNFSTTVCISIVSEPTNVGAQALAEGFYDVHYPRVSPEVKGAPYDNPYYGGSNVSSANKTYNTNLLY